MSSIKKLAIKGAVWTFASYGASQVLRFGSNLVLTRLLFPKLFGLMALVYVFITGLHLFSDIGIATSVVQNKRGDDPDFLNTAWTLQAVRGLGLWVCCLVLAWPAAGLYNEPQLLWLLPIVGLNTVISGFNSTALFTLNRHLSVKQLAIYELTGQVVSMAVTIIWAVFNKSIWALVVSGLVTSVFQLVWSHRMNSGAPNRFAWEKEASHELISFGKWIFVSTLLTFLAGQSDRLILGKLFTFELLGVYGVAFTLADIPRSIILALGGKVIFPTFSKFAELPREEFRLKIQKTRKYLLISTAIGLAILVSFGDILISVLYDNRYAAAAWMLPILALGVWPAILLQSIDMVFLAIGNPRYMVYATFSSALFLIAGIFIGFNLLGPLGAVIAVPLSNVPPYLVTVYGLWRERLACLRQDIWTTMLFLALLAILSGGRIAAGFKFPLPGIH